MVARDRRSLDGLCDSVAASVTSRAARIRAPQNMRLTPRLGDPPEAAMRCAGEQEIGAAIHGSLLEAMVYRRHR